MRGEVGEKAEFMGKGVFMGKKMRNFCFIFMFLPLLFISCATAMKMDKNMPPDYSPNYNTSSAKMDFIGFKSPPPLSFTEAVIEWGSISNTTPIKAFPDKLQAANIADNKKDFYFGVYSLQEIQEFKTDKRYLTFVEVTESKLLYADHPPIPVLGYIGAGAMGIGGSLVWLYPGLGGAFLVGGGLSTLLGFTIPKGSCDMIVSGAYRIFVYDKQEKRIAYASPDTIKIYEKDHYVGLYGELDEIGKMEVNTYYSQIVTNAILRAYSETVLPWVNQYDSNH